MSESQSLRVLVVHPMANFDHLRAFSYEMQFELERLGCRAHALDVGRPTSPVVIERAVAEHAPDFIFSFNAAGAHFTRAQGGPLESASCPWLTFMVDDPVFHQDWGRFLRRPHVVGLFGDPQSLISAARLGVAAERVHLVHAGGHLCPWVEDAERVHEVLFVGTVHDPEAVRRGWHTVLTPGAVQVAELVAESWGPRVADPVQLHLDTVLRALGVELPEEERLAAEPLLLGNVIRYVKALHRVQIFRAFSDLPISVFGSGFRELFPDSAFRFFPNVSFAQSQEEICRSKVVINAQTLAVHAAGERALGALLNGALLASSESRFLAAELEAGVDFIPFSLEPASMERARAAVVHFLEDPEARTTVTRRVREKVRARHTWRERAERVLAIARAHRAGDQPGSALRRPPDPRALVTEARGG
ncbi:MAG: glycosyltransferase family 1 protein [Polyangiaceae bacterium]|nr:glycosyltransferase family 1 protein [Polyangiaceae bacterium]